MNVVTRRQALSMLCRSLPAFFLVQQTSRTQLTSAADSHPAVIRTSRGAHMEQTRTASQSMNPFRLPNTVIPMRYDLRLEPDLTTYTFTGRETVALSVMEATSEVVFNAAELQIAEASIEGDAGRRQPGTIELTNRRNVVAFGSKRRFNPVRGGCISHLRVRSTTSYAASIAAPIMIRTGRRAH